LAYSVSGHHKSAEVLENRNFLLKFYYSIPILFGYCCIGCEFFYIFLYVHYFFSHRVIEILVYACAPGFFIKNVINVAQLLSAATTIAEGDAAAANKANKK
jgi:hypothetical protein